MSNAFAMTTVIEKCLNYRTEQLILRPPNSVCLIIMIIFNVDNED